MSRYMTVLYTLLRIARQRHDRLAITLLQQRIAKAER
jgi:hypothetical protein